MLSSFSEAFDKSKIVAFVNFQGMKVADLTDLRRTVRKAGGTMQVVKKTLINRALKEKGIDLSVEDFKGEIAAVFGFNDEIEVVKIVDEFAKSKQLPEFRGGVMGVAVLSEAEIKTLAALPSREELLAKLVGSIYSPVRGIVQVLGGNMRALVYALQAISEAKQ